MRDVEGANFQMTMENEDRSAFNPIQLQEKAIEPDDRLLSKINRNFQLGNLPKKSMEFYYHRLERGIDLMKYPQLEGGWLLAKYGEKKFQKTDATCVLSNSSEAMLRTLLSTQRKVNLVKDETPSRNFMGALRGTQQ